jgi:hypothetical protein
MPTATRQRRRQRFGGHTASASRRVRNTPSESMVQPPGSARPVGPRTPRGADSTAAVGPTSATRPSASTTTWSARVTASSTSWVTSTAERSCRSPGATHRASRSRPVRPGRPAHPAATPRVRRPGEAESLLRLAAGRLRGPTITGSTVRANLPQPASGVRTRHPAPVCHPAAERHVGRHVQVNSSASCMSRAIRRAGRVAVDARGGVRSTRSPRRTSAASGRTSPRSRAGPSTCPRRWRPAAPPRHRRHRELQVDPAPAPSPQRTAHPAPRPSQPPRSEPEDHHRRNRHQQHRQRHRGVGIDSRCRYLQRQGPGNALPRTREGQRRTRPVTERTPAPRRRPAAAAAAARSPATTPGWDGHPASPPPSRNPARRYAPPLPGDHRQNGSGRTNAWARITAVVLNAIRMPTASKYWPISPSRVIEQGDPADHGRQHQRQQDQGPQPAHRPASPRQHECHRHAHQHRTVLASDVRRLGSQAVVDDGLAISDRSGASRPGRRWPPAEHHERRAERRGNDPARQRRPWCWRVGAREDLGHPRTSREFPQSLPSSNICSSANSVRRQCAHHRRGPADVPRFSGGTVMAFNDEHRRSLRWRCWSPAAIPSSDGRSPRASAMPDTGSWSAAPAATNRGHGQGTRRRRDRRRQFRSHNARTGPLTVPRPPRHHRQRSAPRWTDGDPRVHSHATAAYAHECPGRGR